MAINDCGICDLVTNCGAQIMQADFPTVTTRLLCDLDTKVDAISNTQTGQVLNASSGYAASVTKNLTVDTAAYSINDCIGGIHLFLGAFGASHAGIIQNVVLTDKNFKNKQVTLYFFNANPSASTLTDQAPLVIAAADQPKVVGIYTITQFYALAASGYGVGLNLGIAVKSTGTTLYVAMVAAEAVTYTAANDLSLNISIV